MATFETRLGVDGGLRPLYQIVVNDNGPDGGTSFAVQVGDISSAIPPEVAAPALQVFAAALTEPMGYRVLSITRAVVTETTL
ncbi:hypothetical protein OG539_32875 [Actinacidiphila glaucinigra]|uniref:hypothetical protein n=1 Tax=Actinacidiphila glaucinigra TaxID=235986 RepID=UPI003244BDC1